MTAIRIPPTLRNEVGGERQVEAFGENVREVLEDLARRYPALESHLFEEGQIAPFVNVYLGGEDVRTLDGLDTTVDGQPMIPGRTPSTPPSAQLGASSGGGGVGKRQR